MIFVVVRIQNSMLCIQLKAGYHGLGIRDGEYKRGIKQFTGIIANRVLLFCRAMVAFLEWTVVRMMIDKRRLRRKTVRTCVLQNE